MEPICTCWLIDANLSRFGLRDVERKLKMMEYAESIAAEYKEIMKAAEEKVAVTEPDPSHGSEAAEVEMLTALKAAHYIYKTEKNKYWTELTLLCGRPGWEKRASPPRAYNVAEYHLGQRATCTDCLRLASCVPTSIVERDIF